VETDLGEYINSTGARAAPYHIVAAGAPPDPLRCGRSFHEALNVPRETVIEKQTAIARAVLRQKFLAADIGISGANFLGGRFPRPWCWWRTKATSGSLPPRPKIHIAIAESRR